MTDWNTCPAVERNPRKISGAWAFTGTRVPVYALFENLESGATVEQFLEWFPEVKEWQVTAVLNHETHRRAKRSASPRPDTSSSAQTSWCRRSGVARPHRRLPHFTSDTTLFTTTICTSSSFVSTNAIRPSGPKAVGNSMVPAR